MQKEISDVIDHENYPFIGGCYMRSIGVYRDKLDSKISDMYGIKNPSITCSSGMNAIYLLIQSIIDKNNKNEMIFLVADEMYSDTKRLLNYFVGKHQNLKVIYFSIQQYEDTLDIFKQYKHAIKLMLFESCSNPSGRIFEFEKLVMLKRHAAGCIICVDNTWLSPVLFNPFFYEVDVVVESMTKYLSSGKRISGHITVKNKKLCNYIRNRVQLFGIHVSEETCHTVYDLLDTLEKRVNDASIRMGICLEKMQQIDKINKIVHPFLESHCCYKKAQKYFKGYPSIVILHICSTEDKVKSYFQNNMNSQIVFETSYGNEYAKIDPWPINGSLIEEAIDGVWIRLSMGYNTNVDNLLDEITRFINTEDG